MLKKKNHMNVNLLRICSKINIQIIFEHSLTWLGRASPRLAYVKGATGSV